MSKRKIFIIYFSVFVLGLLFITFTHAIDKVPSDYVPWQKFKKTHGENWQIQWNEKTGTPHRVFGNKKSFPRKVKSLKSKGTASFLPESEFENVARLFVDQNNGFFRIK